MNPNLLSPLLRHLSQTVIGSEEASRLLLTALLGNGHVLIEGAPGIGKNSLALIRAWLNSHGYEMPSLPPPPPNQRDAQRQRKLERAIDYLRWNGYEVHHSS